jgi:hypothetical protein
LLQDNSTLTVCGNEIKYYGFYYPPVGIIDILNLVMPPTDASFFVLDPILTKELPDQDIKNASNPWVIISTQEGSSHRWFDRLIPQLIELGVKPTQIVLRSACLWDPDSSIRNIHTIVDECSDFVSAMPDLEQITVPTHHFVCLNRLHRWQRYQLVKQILDRNLDQYGSLSYIEIPSHADIRFNSLTKPDVDWHQQRNLTDPGTAGALFNIISEAAYEPDPETDVLIHHHRPGMTEKSYKCFALFQVPVWLAPYRAVACYRKLGFDVFDDLVDHAYDLEPDPVKRVHMVADQIEKLCQLSLDDLKQLKQELIPRFKKNLAVLKSYAHNFNSELPQWESLFLDNNLN